MRGMMWVVLTAMAMTTVSAGCHPSLSQEYVSLLPGSPEEGRGRFGVKWTSNAELITLETTGMSPSTVREASDERFNSYLNRGYVPLGESSSRSSGQREDTAIRLAQDHGAAIVILEIDDPPPTTRKVQGSRPTLYTESVRITGTKNFEGSVTTMGWEPAMVDVWVDPFQATCRLWAERSWPPVLGVYFRDEMCAFEGWAASTLSHPIKDSRDMWLLQHPGKAVPPMGAVIGRVLDQTGATAIGLRLGDIILALDGQSISDESEARRLLNDSAGQAVLLLVMRCSADAESLTKSGWQVEPPANPLYLNDAPLEWYQLSRRVRLQPFQPRKKQLP